MWARCCSLRRTKPFSVMICRNFSTVLYCAGLRRLTLSWTWRTVLGPRLQRTVRISSSASVGRGGCCDIRKHYYEVFTMSRAPAFRGEICRRNDLRIQWRRRRGLPDLQDGDVPVTNAGIQFLGARRRLRADVGMAQVEEFSLLRPRKIGVHRA